MIEIKPNAGMPKVSDPHRGTLCPACLHRSHGALRCGWGAGDPEGSMGCECIYFPTKKTSG